MKAKQLLKNLYNLSHDVIWEIEASREFEGKSFINPSDLNRIAELIDNISNDVEKTISQTREETIREIEESLPKDKRGYITKEGLCEDCGNKLCRCSDFNYILNLVKDILNKLKK